MLPSNGRGGAFGCPFTLERKVSAPPEVVMESVGVAVVVQLLAE